MRHNRAAFDSEDAVVRVQTIFLMVPRNESRRDLAFCWMVPPAVKLQVQAAWDPSHVQERPVVDPLSDAAVIVQQEIISEGQVHALEV